jgi:hypothetical protein
VTLKVAELAARETVITYWLPDVKVIPVTWLEMERAAPGASVTPLAVKETGLVVVVQEPVHVTDPVEVQVAPATPLTPRMVMVAVPERD